MFGRSRGGEPAQGERVGTLQRGLVVGLIFVFLSSTAIAEAKPSIHSPFSDSGSFAEPDFCGAAALVDWQESGITLVRPVKDSEGEAYYGHTNFELREVI